MKCTTYNNFNVMTNVEVCIDNAVTAEQVQMNLEIDIVRDYTCFKN